jgi:hypothetical protein
MLMAFSGLSVAQGCWVTEGEYCSWIVDTGRDDHIMDNPAASEECDARAEARMKSAGAGSTGGGNTTGRGSCRVWNVNGSWCIEPDEPDNQVWCEAASGLFSDDDCSGGYVGLCELPAGGDLTVPATVYYYGYDGTNDCTGAGGTYTPA